MCKQLYSIAAVVTTRGHKGRGDAMLESESDSEPAKRPKAVADVKQVVRSTAADDLPPKRSFCCKLLRT